jgi:hypothetical protein
MLRIIASLIISILLVQVSGCADQDAYSPKNIRAHDTLIKAVAHANPALNAERYCSQCHGQSLVGGTGGEPSCYQCHGRMWTDDEESYSNSTAPANHSELHGRFFHDPAHANAEAVCSTCHGQDLEGAGKQGAPPCLLCHEKLWQ